MKKTIITVVVLIVVASLGHAKNMNELNLYDHKLIENDRSNSWPAMMPVGLKQSAEEISPVRNTNISWESESDRGIWKRLYERAVSSKGGLVLHRRNTTSTNLFKVDDSGAVSLVSISVSVSETYTGTTITTYKTDRRGEQLLSFEEIYIGTNGYHNLTGIIWDTNKVSVTNTNGENESKYFKERRSSWISKGANANTIR